MSDKNKLKIIHNKYPILHVVLVGEQGIGKTRVAMAVQEILQEMGISSVIGEGTPGMTAGCFQSTKTEASIVTTTRSSFKKKKVFGDK